MRQPSITVRAGRRIAAPVLGRPRLETPLFVFCHHKVGTVLVTSVLRDVSRWFKWRFEVVRGEQTVPSPDADIVLFIHARHEIAEEQPRSFTGVHIRRDPREVVVSSYLYHRHTIESWCVATQAGPDATTSAKIPLSQRYRSAEWKRAFVESLDGTSYQQTLLGLTQAAGLRFEMTHYAGWTIEHMLGLHRSDAVSLRVRFEDLMNGFDTTFAQVFSVAGFTGQQQSVALRAARAHDLSRKAAADVAAMPHVHGPRPGRWRRYFDEGLQTDFDAIFPNVVKELGYA